MTDVIHVLRRNLGPIWVEVPRPGRALFRRWSGSGEVLVFPLRPLLPLPFPSPFPLPPELV